MRDKVSSVEQPDRARNVRNKTACGGTVREERSQKKRSGRERKMDSDADVCHKRGVAVSELSRAWRCDLFMR